MTRPVYVEYTTKGPRQGERFVVSSAAKAHELHPDARILHYEDEPGTPYKEPKAETTTTTATAATKPETKKDGDR